MHSCPDVSRRHCSLVVITASGSLSLSSPPSAMIPSLGRRRCDVDVPLRAEFSPILSTWSSCGSLCYLPSVARRSFSGEVEKCTRLQVEG